MGDTERETMDLDVLFIGAGPANLSAACRLMSTIREYNEKATADGKKPLEEPTMLVIDKGAKTGNHNLSGAVVDPVALKHLFPELPESEWPFLTRVTQDQTYYLTPTGKTAVPGLLLPPEMRHDACHLASIGDVTRFLAAKCEEMGVEVYTEFAATELLRAGRKVLGARIGDKGLDKDGNPGGNFSPGMDLFAKVTVLGEGSRGYLATQLIQDLRLDVEANNQSWGLGLKELIEIPQGRIKKGQVIHTFGYPLDMKTYGGSFLYGLDDNLAAIGIVFGLDYADPMLNSHETFLKLKRHPFIASILEGGKVVEYGAKTLPEGGWFAIPQLAADGAVLVGDSAGMLNCMRLKGIHLAMQSGMLAADRIFQAMLQNDFSAPTLDYRAELEASWAGKELHRARNFRQGYHGGLIFGMIGTGMHIMSGGALPGGRKTMPPDHQGLKKAPQAKACTLTAAPAPQAPQPKVPTDDTLYLDILTDVYKSGSIHNEHQPPHCKILDPEACKRCRADYAAPCARFCPTKVYEEKLDADGKFLGMQVNFSNCVHCKTCEIKDPLRNIRWTPPEGGDGPKYQRM